MPKNTEQSKSVQSQSVSPLLIGKKIIMFIIGALVCFMGGPYAVWYLNNKLTDKSTE